MTAAEAARPTRPRPRPAGAAAPATPDATIDGKPVPVGKLPVNVVHGQEGIWVTNRLGDSVSLVDGDPAKQLAEFGLASSPRGLRSATARSGSADTTRRPCCG